jgi:hypothetical protein
VGVAIVLLAGFIFGGVLLYFVQGTNIMSDPGDRNFAQIYLVCIPFIAALIGVPNGIERFKKKK